MSGQWRVSSCGLPITDRQIKRHTKFVNRLFEMTVQPSALQISVASYPRQLLTLMSKKLEKRSE